MKLSFQAGVANVKALRQKQTLREEKGHITGGQ